MPEPQPLKAVLALRRISNRGLARAVGVTPAWLGKVINGHVPPSDDLVSKITAALDMPTEQLFRPVDRPRRRRQPGDDDLVQVAAS